MNENDCGLYEHTWPAELSSDAECESCGLRYDQYMEEE